MLSPPALEVYCDFDGTVTLEDVVDIFLEKFASPEWLDVEKEWKKGEIGSHECLERQLAYARIPNINEMKKFIESVHIDPSFPDFARWCQKQKIPLAIISDGFDLFIQYILKHADIDFLPVYANRMDPSLKLDFPFAQKDCVVKAGVCKCAVVKEKSPRSKTILIGDGLSDLCVADKVDRVFAKSQLISLCKEKSIPFVEFKDFHDVRSQIESYLRSPNGIE